MGAAAAAASAPGPAAAQLDTAVSVTQQQPDEVLYGGFGLDLTLSDASGLNAVGQNYRNELSLYVEPRWNVGRRFFRGSATWQRLTLSARFVVSRALAGTSEEYFDGQSSAGPLEPCSDLTPGPGGAIDPREVRRCNPAANGRRTDYSDMSLTASLPRFLVIPRTGLALSSSLRVILPTSAQSRYQSLRFGATANSGVSRLLFGDRLRLGYNLGFTKNVHAYSTPGVSASGGEAGELGGNTSSAVSGVGLSNLFADPARVGVGGFNTSFSFSNSLSAHVKLSESWSLDVLYMWVDGFTYKHRCLVEAGGQTIDTCRSGEAVASASGSEVEGRGHRRSQVFWATATYGVNDWLSLSAAWTTWAPRMKPDSSYRQGFISTDYNAFTSVLLSTTISIDGLAGKYLDRRRAARAVSQSPARASTK